MGAVINGANEIAVAAFLEGKIGFLDIYDIVENVTGRVAFVPNPSLDDIFESDGEARALASSLI